MSLLRDDDTGLVLIQPDWPDCPPNVRAYSSTRLGGVSLHPYGDMSGDGGLNLGDHVGDALDAVRMNRDCLSDFFPTPVTFLSQIHGNLAIDVAAIRTGERIQADASYSLKPNVACAVLTADCLPILLASKNGSCVAAVHAGWRGLANGVIESAVQQMRLHGVHDISVWLGPAIGPQAFEVGTEVKSAFVHKMSRHESCFTPMQEDGKFFANIYELAKNILYEQKIVSISGGEYCTFKDEELFYSYRRDGVTGRMASWIWFE